VTALVRSELLKVRTTRGWWAYLIVLVLLVGAGTAAEVGSRSESERSGLEFQLALADLVGITSLLAIILGITMVTTEFRHGTITPTLLVTPSRERVLAGKTLAGLIVALVFAVIALVVIVAIAVPWTSIAGGELQLTDGDVLERAGKALLGVVLWLLMGVAIGSIVHSQVAALVGTLIWIFVAETLLWGLFAWRDVDRLAEYLPFRALDAADGVGGEDLLSYGAGVAVSIAWILAIGAAGVVRTRRRDIT
jgi:ABC-type transport system involved in multi-copper enzyme maturation permease subunit